MLGCEGQPVVVLYKELYEQMRIYRIFLDDRGQKESSYFLCFKYEKSKQKREAGLNLNKLNDTRDWQY